MAKIIQLSLDTLQVISYREIRDDSIITPIFVIEHHSVVSEELLAELKNDYPHYDTYHNIGHDIYSEIHRHSDHEVRAIVKGTGNFYVPYNGSLYIAECSTGDILKLTPNIDYWFSTYDEIFAIRLYSDNDSHVSLQDKASRIVHKAHHKIGSLGHNFSF